MRKAPGFFIIRFLDKCNQILHHWNILCSPIIHLIYQFFPEKDTWYPGANSNLMKNMYSVKLTRYILKN